jgi:hypothetical protein
VVVNALGGSKCSVSQFLLSNSAEKYQVSFALIIDQKNDYCILFWSRRFVKGRELEFMVGTQYNLEAVPGR